MSPHFVDEVFGAGGLMAAHLDLAVARGRSYRLTACGLPPLPCTRRLDNIARFLAEAAHARAR